TSSSSTSLKQCPINVDAIKSSYDPTLVEDGKYKWWEESGFFKPRPSNDGSNKKYSMVLPPPNVTGSLHIGHALTTTIEDALVRYKRMMGYETLWVPGLDHSGIATQVAVEKELRAKKQLSRHDLGRERFLEEVYKWTDLYSHNINNQLRRTGASLDWSRSVFTLDKQRAHAVETAFLRFFRSGLVYRATRLVNWCPELRSVISDIEVDHVTFEKPTHHKLKSRPKTFEFGVIYDVAYQVEGGDKVTVSTTRPETIFGDTALAIHPTDPRYTHLHGKYALHPFTGRRIPIVLDDVLVDPKLGTGVVKVTPAHDFNDFQCGQRHKLDSINILTEAGKLNDNVPEEFRNIDRLDARYIVIGKLKEMGLFEGKRPHATSIAICSRSGDLLEPVLRPQWYVDCSEMGKRALDLVESGKINIIPESYKDNWARWLGSIQDWCISRQLWWGNPIPAYRVIKMKLSKWVVGESVEFAEQEAIKKYGLVKGSFSLKQDEDVLDTWFSSGLFPISSLGWPESTSDLSKFYPLDVMETGSDILFFWVARMVMMCTTLAPEQQVPFKTILLHPLIRDSQGRKMSKSLGNVIDPLNVINGITLEQLKVTISQSNLSEQEKNTATKGMAKEFPNGIPKCGTDALRIGLSQFPISGKDINLDMSRIIGQRLFCNKIWNATKLVLLHVNQHDTVTTLYGANNGVDSAPFNQESISIIDRWILNRLSSLVTLAKESFDKHNMSQLSQALYSFLQYDYCDFYLEVTKVALNRSERKPSNVESHLVMASTLECFLRLLHPFMPYLTEDLWQRLPKPNQSPLSIMIADYPSISHPNHQQLSFPELDNVIAV
ncbi:hypothetical protein SAMD00019534_071550, partial [Acytostelium subglobosum LB1]|uniref:hypothetical protein n=1 Tax=Acytostelium subglobosum LB1 TaxID=1410327 RepID=UPI000644AC0C